MTLLAPPADGSVVPFLFLQTKSALREAGADPHDVSDALFCYRRAIGSGQSVRDAAIWALRFFYLLSAATAEAAEPSLSAPELAPRESQDRWIAGNDDDREDACEDEGSEHDGREPEEDNDASDYEASLCGIGFGIGDYTGADKEGTSAPFTLDQSQGR